MADLKEVAKTKGSFFLDTILGVVHVHPFADENPKKLDIRSISYQREMSGSRRGLEELGFKVATYVAPYNYWTPEMREVCKYYYQQAANGGKAPTSKEKQIGIGSNAISSIPRGPQKKSSGC